MKIQELKDALRPKGTKDVVRLDLKNHFFQLGTIERAINHIEVKTMMEDGLNPLEILGFILLIDSAKIHRGE